MMVFYVELVSAIKELGDAIVNRLEPLARGDELTEDDIHTLNEMSQTYCRLAYDLDETKSYEYGWPFNSSLGGMIYRMSQYLTVPIYNQNKVFQGIWAYDWIMGKFRFRLETFAFRSELGPV